MKIVHLTAGTGAYFCGTCLRDYALVAALRRQGHEVLVVPLYLPPMLETADGGGDEASCPIFFGGVNVYLQQKSWLFRHSPAWIDRLLNARWLLRHAAARASMTRAAELGELTLSMLRGAQGRQGKELRKLVTFLGSRGRFDIVSLSNALLLGLAAPLREALGARVVCTLQGEDSFLNSLSEPWRTEAWTLTAELARAADALVAVSAYHAGVMAGHLGLPATRVQVVHNGLDLTGYAPAEAPPDPPALGYLARMTHGKGLATLVEAFIRLKASPAHARLRLRVGGSCTPADEVFVAGLRRRLAEAGVAEAVEWWPNLDREGKIALLRSLSLFSVPATYGESFGLYLIEALACGVPVVQPSSGAFPELIAVTGGGALCAADDPAALAEAVGRLLADPAARRVHAAQGLAAVRGRFTADAMSATFAGICARVLAGSPQSTPGPGPHAPLAGATRAP